MAGAVDVGTGAALNFGTSSYLVFYESFDVTGFQRAVVDTTHMLTSGARTKMVGDLYDPPVMTVQAQWNQDEPAPHTAAAETVTLTFPVPSGSTNGGTMAGTAAITQNGFSIPLEGKMTASLTITFLDDITFADAS